MAEDPLSQAIAFFREGDPAKAEASCVIILQRNPGHAEANHLLGAIRFQQGRTAEAITFLKRAAASPLATAEIYNHLGSAHYRSGQREEAQDAFERAYKKWATWQPLAPAEAWVHRIAVNAAVSYKRKMKLREVGEVIRRIGRPGLAPDPQVLAESSDLAAALAKLPPKQAAVIVLRHYHGYTNRAIAQALGIPERTVASRLAVAKGRMRQMLQHSYGPVAADEMSVRQPELRTANS